MLFLHSKNICEAWPNHFCGLVKVVNFEHPGVLLPHIERLAARSVAPEVLAAAGVAVEQWRQVFLKMGAKGKCVSSIESLRNYLSKRGRLFAVNPLVDFYNYYSLNVGTPMGAYDLTRFVGNLKLCELAATEIFTPMGNRDRAETPHPGEIGYADDEKVICRYWNWRDCDQTKVTATTLDVLFVFDILVSDAVTATSRYGSFVEDFRAVFGGQTVPCGVTGTGLGFEVKI